MIKKKSQLLVYHKNGNILSIPKLKKKKKKKKSEADKTMLYKMILIKFCDEMLYTSLTNYNI